MRFKISIVILFYILITSNLFANEGNFSGLMFGDVYWVAANHDSTIKNQNGIWLRRIYFTFDDKLSKTFSIRFRLEANNAGDFSTKAKLYPFIKDAYLKWNLGQHSIYLGLSPSPTFEYIEEVWGYRSVEKTLVDLQKLGSSRDMGIALKGSFIQSKRVYYHFMIGNGNGNNTEDNRGKKVMFSFMTEIIKNLFFQGYWDWDDLPKKKDRYTGQCFLTYKTPSFRAAAQFIHQTRRMGKGIDNQKLRFGSVFAVAKIRDDVWGFVRADRAFDPNPDGEEISYIPFFEAKSFFILAGLDFSFYTNVHIMPNIELITYDFDKDSAPDSDLFFRLTFYYKWK